MKLDPYLKSLIRLSRRPLVHLINSLFSKMHGEEACVSFGNIEFGFRNVQGEHESRRADGIVCIEEGGVLYKYHLEFQTLYDASMALRMFEYGFCIATEDATVNDGYLTVEYPEQIVLFIEPHQAIEDALTVAIHYPNGYFVYTVPTFKYWEYDIPRLVEHRLFPLLPIQLTKHEKAISRISRWKESEKKRIALEEQFQDLASLFREITEILLSVYHDLFFTFRDLERAVDASKSMLQTLYEKYDHYGLYEKTREEVHTMLSWKLTPAERHELKLEGLREFIVTTLKGKEFSFDEEQVLEKLSGVRELDKMFGVCETAFHARSMQEFMRHV